MGSLRLEHPPGHEAARRYTYAWVLGERLGLSFEAVERPGDTVRLSLGDGGPGLVLPDVLFGTPPHRWLTPASLPPEPLARWAADQWPAAGRSLPLIYARAPEAAEDDLALDLDAFGSAFFMLTRYEELVAPVRDAHGRFPAAASLAWREGFLERAIVDEYVEALWAAIARLWPGLPRRRPGYRLRLTHDVDWPLYGLGLRLREAARTGLGDLVRRRDPGAAFGRFSAYWGARRGHHRGDPYDTFDFLMDVSEAHGLRSAFYFIPARSAGRLDGNTELDHPWVRGLLRRIHARGHEVGLHPSYHTYRDAARTRREFERLRQAAGEEGIEQAEWGGRQHFLRWENPTTWRNWEHAGLTYDASLGYADHMGFRAGTSHEFAPFDLELGRPLRLRERPLTAMEVTAFDAMGLDGPEALRRVTQLRDAARTAQGEFTLLWHNNRLADPADRRMYGDWVSALAA